MNGTDRIAELKATIAELEQADAPAHMADAARAELEAALAQSDASGLIEAAEDEAENFERLVKIIEAWRTSVRTSRWVAQQINKVFVLRARAADRSAT